MYKKVQIERIQKAFNNILVVIYFIITKSIDSKNNPDCIELLPSLAAKAFSMLK